MFLLYHTFQSSRLPWFRLHSRTLKKATGARKATLKITATKRRGLVATRNCERSQRANYGQGPQMSALLTGRTLRKQKARRKEHSHWKSEKQLHHGGGGAAAEGHTLRAKGKLAATSRDRKPVLTNSQIRNGRKNIASTVVGKPMGRLGRLGWLGWLGRLGWRGWLERRRRLGRLGRFGRGGKLDNWEIGKLGNWEFSR